MLDLVEQRRARHVTVVFNQPVHGFQYTTTERSVLPVDPPRAHRSTDDIDVKPAADTSNVFVRLITTCVLTDLYEAVIQSAVGEQLARKPRYGSPATTRTNCSPSSPRSTTWPASTP